tara:strand:- start:66 stop:188 length:123 start_codon:yes stop_codon:yes gene_type:complete
MNFEKLKEQILEISQKKLSDKARLFTTLSLGWIIFIGYLT